MMTCSIYDPITVLLDHSATSAMSDIEGWPSVYLLGTTTLDHMVACLFKVTAVSSALSWRNLVIVCFRVQVYMKDFVSNIR